jgi:hypothetical protein
MIRKLIIPVVAAALLGGCVSAGYSYRQGNGDYYHGTPSVEYRYHSPYYSAPYYGGPYYSSPYYSPYPYGYYGPPYGSYRYTYPTYRYRQYYGYPYGQPYRHYRGVAPRPRIDRTPDSTRSHWRNLDRLQRRGDDPGRTMAPRTDSPSQPPTVSMPAPRSGGSAIGGMVRRAKERDSDTGTTP